MACISSNFTSNWSWLTWVAFISSNLLSWFDFISSSLLSWLTYFGWFSFQLDLLLIPSSFPLHSCFTASSIFDFCSRVLTGIKSESTSWRLVGFFFLEVFLDLQSYFWHQMYRFSSKNTTNTFIIHCIFDLVYKQQWQLLSNLQLTTTLNNHNN